jgi:hypothetical protein
MGGRETGIRVQRVPITAVGVSGVGHVFFPVLGILLEDLRLGRIASMDGDI